MYELFMSNFFFLKTTKMVAAGASGNEAMGILMTDGKFYTRGRNTNGRLATGDTTDIYDHWYQAATNVADVWGGGYTFLKKDKQGAFQLVGALNAIGTSSNVSNFTALPEAFSGTFDLTKIIDVCISVESIMFLLSNGDVYMAGVNTNGSCGLSTTNITTPLRVATNVRSIAMAATTSYYVTNDNKLYCSGDNSFNQLGNGNTTTRKAFAELTIDGNSGVVQDVNAGLTGAHILTTDNKVYGVGTYLYGQGSGRLTVPTLTTLPADDLPYSLNVPSIGNSAMVVTNSKGTMYYGRASLGNYYGLPSSSSDAYVPIGTILDHKMTTSFLQLSNSSWFLNNGFLYHTGARTITDTYNSTVVDSNYTKVDAP